MVRAREVKESVARTLESELFAASRGIRGLSRPFEALAALRGGEIKGRRDDRDGVSREATL